MANIPNYDVTNLSFGPGVLYIADYDTTNDLPTYPTTDVGAVKEGGEFRVTRDVLDVEQGAPKLIIKSFVVGQKVELAVASIEWKLENLFKALGGGTVTGDVFRFGGDMDLDRYSLRYVHQTPNGDFYVIKLWQVNPVGEITIAFGGDVHEFNMTFRALPSEYGWYSTDYTGESLGTADGTIVNFTKTLTNIPVEMKSVTITAGTVTLTDDGFGAITGTGGYGTIDYATGAVDVTFDTAPATGDDPTCAYSAVDTTVKLGQTTNIVEVEKIPVS